MVKAKTVKDNSFLALVVVALISALGAFGASYVTFIGVADKTDLERLTQAEQSITQMRKDYHELRTLLTLENNKLRKEADDLRKSNILLNLQVLDLKIKLKAEYDRKQLLQTFLDSLPFPAWIKTKREDGLFVMEMINDAYVIKYQVTKKAYQGATDYKIHPRHLVKQYEKSDNLVISSNKPVTAHEEVKVNGVIIPLIVWKFSIELDDDRSGVGGIALNSANMKEILSIGIKYESQLKAVP
ncbi:MAG: hypothetical protein ACJAUY_000656 [Cognaticolwellia sp.]|jgi:hypothetical protein